ncbi:hypothetical protein [Butyrivibrio sp. INlla14]|uniref:hypothetical protein n=1 Tax=Butyrivibrio sp. INlla14 TaxID=1520808 RepID=UPI0008772193|nr:hypothetical protein [Butyrivibrio sp. INlla14]SCY04113.1 hypothetical protein SAMN02910371_00841 [Butyrivibrio sp. INlla14]
MEMKPSEILQSYENAQYKTKQIGILAELNACSKEEITEILKEMGAELLKRKYQKKEEKEPEKKEWEEPELLPEPREIPQSIQLVLYERLDVLDAKIREYTQGKENAEKEYMEIVEFLKLK